MEFTVVSSYTGENLEKNDILQTMKIIYIHPEYLIHMQCESVEEYIKSLVHTSCRFDSVTMLRMLETENYRKNFGKWIFRHTKTLKTAIIYFESRFIYITNSSIYAISKITSIEWQKNDDLASWIGHIEAKISLGELSLFKEVTRDDMAYISIPLNKIPHMSDDIKHQLRILKCIFGTNVAYEMKGTHRSVLLPKSLIRPKTIEHDHLWTIFSCGTDTKTIIFMETSKQCLAWLHITDEELKQDFVKTMSQFHEDDVNEKILHHVFPQCLNLKVGESCEHVLPFIVDNKVENVKIVCHRSRSVVVLVFTRMRMRWNEVYENEECENEVCECQNA